MKIKGPRKAREWGIGQKNYQGGQDLPNFGNLPQSCEGGGVVVTLVID